MIDGFSKYQALYSVLPLAIDYRVGGLRRVFTLGI